jgi:hypothetical protein
MQDDHSYLTFKSCGRIRRDNYTVIVQSKLGRPTFDTKPSGMLFLRWKYDENLVYQL